jgi:hypothetical protein
MAKKTVGIVLSGVALLALALSLLYGSPWSSAKAAETKISGIIWEKSFQKDGRTITPGSAQADFGRFNFYWSVDAANQGSLVTIEARGGGELPPRTKQLFIVINSNRSTTLLQQWFPLAGSQQPVKLKAIVTVNSDQLFTVLPKPDLPVVVKQTNQIGTVSWGKLQFHDKISYLPGKVRTKVAVVKIFWKFAVGQTPELMGGEPSGVRERQLYLVDHTSTKTTTIYQERQPPASRQGVPCLWPVAVVKTDRLLAKLAIIQK